MPGPAPALTSLGSSASNGPGGLFIGGSDSGVSWKMSESSEVEEDGGVLLSSLLLLRSSLLSLSSLSYSSLSSSYV